MAKMTNKDFCCRFNITVSDACALANKYGFKSLDEFFNAPCSYVPEFELGDILFGGKDNPNSIVVGYNKDEMAYRLMPLTDAATGWKLGGCPTVSGSYKDAYYIDKSYRSWGKINPMMLSR